ncbi:MAG: hypothetical protein Q4A32_02170 [Lachnospiraceae bacterium]|nr:hypothetical protein [Lachnospiraceae bacterium]
MYCYRAFGFNIESEFEIAQMLSAVFPEEECDVFVRCGKTSDAMVENPIRVYLDAKFNKEEMWADLEVVRIYVGHGRDIIVDRISEKEGDEGLIQAYITGLAFGAIMHQRGEIPMHGSCVRKDGKAILFTGVSGAGKSSIAAEAIRQGYRLVTDDVTPISIKDGVVVAEPSFPQQKLWEDAVARGGVANQTDHRLYDEDDRTKYAMNVDEAFLNEPAELRGVIQMIPKEELRQGRELISEVRGLEKAVLLQLHTYRTYMLVDQESRQRHFQKCADIASKLKTAHLFRYQDTSEADLLAAAEEFINGK